MFRINKNFAVFYGILLGDGSLSLINKNMKFITISSSIHDDMPFVKKIILPLLRKLRKKETKFKLRPKYGVIEFNFTDAKLFDFISSLGFSIGKKGIGIKIPKIFYKKNLVKYVIQGFFATDGSLVLTKNPNILYPRLEASSISNSLMKQVCGFFNREGIKCNIYERKAKNWKWNQQYRIQANGRKNLELFIKKIGFINPKHKKRLVKLNMAALGVEPRTPSS